MTTLLSRSSFAAAFSILSTLLLACGGGGGGGGKGGGLGGAQCTDLCTQLSTCASTLKTDVGTLTDSPMTDSTCVDECKSLTCTDSAGFLTCAGAVSCTASSTITEVQSALKSCSDTASCKGGGGGGGGGGSASCTTICADLVACASTLSTDVKTLTGDPNMTNANCASECGNQICTSLSTFVSCAAGLTCNSVSGVQGQLQTCSTNGGCGGH